MNVVASVPEVKSADTTDNITEIRETHTSELVIALCGPIGSPIHEVAKTFKKCLEEDFGYERAEILTLSKLIEKLKGPAPTGGTFKRIKYLIDEGDKLREEYGAGILAELAISEIALDRQKYKINDNSERFKPRRVCHIVDSIKNQQELDLLRLVYRDMVYLVGVYAPEPRRTKTLEQRGMSLSEIYTLVDRDSGEEIAPNALRCPVASCSASARLSGHGGPCRMPGIRALFPPAGIRSPSIPAPERRILSFDRYLSQGHPAASRRRWPSSQRPGNTPADRFHNASAALGRAMDGVAEAFEALGKVVGDDGRLMVDVKGVDTRACKAWRELLARMDEEFVVWSRTFRRVHGVGAGPAAPSASDFDNDDVDDRPADDDKDIFDAAE